MAIADAIQRNNSVSVYDEKGRLLFSKPGILQGFTSTTASIQQGRAITTYDEKGRAKFSKPGS